MNKYLTIVKTYWQRGLTYRFTVFAYRVGDMAEDVVLILMWTAIYGDERVIKGFTLPEMVTYILIGNLFSSVVRNFLSGIMSRDIKDGSLSMFLAKPISYFNFIFFREIGRMSLVTIMSLFTNVLVVLFFLNSFVFNFDILSLLVISAMLLLAFVTEMLLAYLIGLVAFWTDEVDGLYSAFEKLKKLFSGGYFPLNLLPPAFVSLSFVLPFGYSFFVPAQLYLKKIDLGTGMKGILIQIIWIVALYALSNLVWKRGLKKYEGVGI
jgi:ABC-2 type transport system permease protein